MRDRRCTWLLAILLCGPAAAAERVGPLVPAVEPAGAIAAELLARFHEAVARGLESGGLATVRAEDARRGLERQKLLECVGGFCVKRAAQAMDVTRVVATRIHVTGKSYDLECRLLASDGAALAKAAGSCDICTFAEAQQTLVRVASDLAKRAPPAAAPAPAAPAHSSKAAAVARRPAPARAAVRAAPPATVGESGGAAHPYLGWAIGFGVAGATAIGLGSYLVSIHGEPTCVSHDPGFDPETQCPDVFATGGSGAVLIGLGAASVVGGFLFYAREQPIGTLGASVAPSATGASASAWLRF
ncbi:MAG: hypothetical protein AABZ30_03525 [Myxococcota bacterium]